MARQVRRRRRDGPEGAVFGGRELDAADLARVRGVVRALRGCLRSEVVGAVCREMGWRRANGAPRLRACRDLLVRLAEAGVITLPPSRTQARALRRSETRPRGPAAEPAQDAPKAAAVVVRRIVVRPVAPHELPRWRAEMARHHYLGDGEIVGETVRHVAEEGGRWVALVAWGAAALKSRHREAWIGWDERTKYQRLPFVTNNVRFLVLPWARVPHLASAVLARSVRRLSRDFEARYGHPVLVAETFVDVERFRGTCYVAANWVRLGETRGMARKGRGYEEHGRKKAIFVLPLHRRAREILSAAMPSPEILRRTTMASMPALYVDVNKLPLDGQGGLIEALRGIKDWRKPRGLRYRLEVVLALAAMGCLSGARSFEAIAEWAKDLPQDLLKRLQCWCWKAPVESTFRRVLSGIDAQEVDRVVCAWLAKQAARGAIALDGKALRGSGEGDGPPVHLLSAVTHAEGIVVAQRQVEEKSNEIPGAKPLLADLDLEGRTVTADAMHTQTDLAKHLVEERKADYVLIAKANQPTLLADLEAIEWESLPPSGQHIRQGARADRAPDDPALE